MPLSSVLWGITASSIFSILRFRKALAIHIPHDNFNQTSLQKRIQRFGTQIVIVGALTSYLHHLIASWRSNQECAALSRLREQKETLKFMDVSSILAVKPIPIEEMGDTWDNIRETNTRLIREMDERDKNRSLLRNLFR